MSREKCHKLRSEPTPHFNQPWWWVCVDCCKDCDDFLALVLVLCVNFLDLWWACVNYDLWFSFSFSFCCKDCDDFLVCCSTGELELGGGITSLLYPKLNFFLNGGTPNFFIQFPNSLIQLFIFLFFNFFQFLSRWCLLDIACSQK